MARFFLKKLWKAQFREVSLKKIVLRSGKVSLQICQNLLRGKN